MAALRFAAIGINHDHIYGQVGAMLGAGAELVAFHAPEEDLAAKFAERFPQARREADRRHILEDESIGLIVSAGISSERAEIALAAMRHGKDAMIDKPGMVSLDQLAELRRVQKETGRVYSICYSEHYLNTATVKAGELVKAGAIGTVVHTLGLGPHRLRKESRPAWFFERARYGGILTDIASHQCEQFLFFTGARDAEVLSATIANRTVPEHPELQDFGDMHLKADNGAAGYVRVDWLTPEGLPVWGDGRLVILGSEGYIELRKNIDIGGRPGKDHLFLVDRKGVRYVECDGTDLPYGRELAADIAERTERHMSQAHCFKAMELALKAQAAAEVRS
jgi:predicted dehydrogenase